MRVQGTLCLLTFAACLAAVPAFAQENGLPGVRLSEFLSNPNEDGNDSAYEWVEIENTSSVAVDLRGWKIGDEKLTDAIGEVRLEAGGRLLIAGKSVIPTMGTVVRPADGTIGGGLNNGGDTIRLLDADGAVVDEVHYGETGLIAPGVGRTLSRTAAGSWRLSQRPTPGEANAFPEAATFLATNPIPIEYETKSVTTSPAAWVLLAGCLAAGSVGIATVTRRRVVARRNIHAT